MQFLRWLVMLCLGVAAASAIAAPVAVEVADPFIELHTGPGEDYPIFHVVERGAEVEILRRRTDWFQVRARGDRTGWVHLGQMEQTLGPDGQPTRFTTPGVADYLQRRWELGFLGGDFGGASLISVYGARALTGNLSLELGLGQALGDYSSTWIARVALQHQPFPEWRVSPFFQLGAGIVRVEPSATLVQTVDREDEFAQVGVGARMYLSKKFFLRAEYNNYLILTTRDDNEDIDEWKLGFGFFF